VVLQYNWLRAKETEISAALEALWLWKDLALEFTYEENDSV